MLKIKDNIDKRKLLDMGFVCYKGEFVKQISCNAGICIDLDGIVGIFRNDECDKVVEQLDILYDLIKDGLVEKVEK